MAQPVDYTREQDFTVYQDFDAEGSEINRELDNISTTTDEIRANLDIIQKDDGQLSNESVGNDQLKDEVIATLAAVTTTAAANASASAELAATHVDSIEGVWSNFNDRYLGSKATAPSLDNDGDPLVNGAIYYDSVIQNLMVYTSNGWVKPFDSGISTMDKFRYTATAGQTDITGVDDGGVDSLLLYEGIEIVTLNGIFMESGTDYTATSDTIVMNEALLVGDELNIYAFGNFDLSNHYNKPQADARFAAHAYVESLIANIQSVIQSAGISVYPIFATDSNGSNQTLTATTSTAYVTFYSSQVEPTLPVLNQIFVRFDGLDGLDGNHGTNGTNGTNGIDGNVGADGVDGNHGNSVAQISIYRRSNTLPSTPTGGSYNFTTNVLTAPTDWSSSPAAGTDPLYVSVSIATTVGSTGTDSTITWSAPELLAVDGTTGNSVYTGSVYLRQEATPSTPVSNTGSFNFGTNVLTAPTGNPATEVWSTSVPTGVDPVWASDSTFSVAGDTGIDSTTVWGTPRKVSENGVDGTSTYLLFVFKRAATAPASPTGGSYNFTTNTPTPPTGWTEYVPTGSDPLYVSTALASISGATGTDSTLTWTAPSIMAQDGTNGTIWYSGSGLPASALGVNGDHYLRTDNESTYIKTSGTWGVSITTLKGADGTNADVFNFIFKDAPNTPTKPSDSSGVPTGWADSAPSSVSNILWTSLGTQTTGTGNFTWGEVQRITAQDGADGVDGNSIAQVTIYLRSSTTVSLTPYGGSYNFSTNTLTAPTSPVTWSASIPSGTGDLYASIAIASVVGTSSTDSSLTWSSPELFVQTGVDGDDGTSVLIVYADDASGTNQSTSQGSYQYVNYKEYTSSTPSLPLSGTTFVRFIGTDGTSGQSIYPIYATSSTGSNQSFSSSSATYVTFYEATSQPSLPVSGQTFVEYVGSDGNTGTSGTSVYTANIYKRSSSTPTTPTGGSFNFGTNALVAPSGWSATVTAGSDPLYVTDATFSVSGDTGTDSTVTWATPVIFAQDGSTGSQGVAGVSGVSTYLFSIYKRSSSAPSAPSGGSYNFGSNTSTPPTGWLASPPAGSTPLYTSTTLASVSGASGTDSSLSWTTPTILVQDGTTGSQGVAGSSGTRGSGRYDKSFSVTTAPAVGSTSFNNNARQTICEALQGSWSTSCSISTANPVAGDIVALTYTESSGNTVTRAAIHDGTGVADNDWQSFALQLDGSLLVGGTVAASAIVADSITSNQIDTGAITADEIDASAVTVSKMNIDGALTISATTGSFKFGKQSADDYNSAGTFLGNKVVSNTLGRESVFMAGNSTSYIRVDDSGVEIIGAELLGSTVSTAPVPAVGVAIDFTTPATYTLYFLASYASFSYEVSGGGKGGEAADYNWGNQYANSLSGGTSKVEVMSSNLSNATVVSSYTASGGTSEITNSGTNSGQGYNGQSFNPSGASSLFTGTGGAGGNSSDGSPATGVSAGGGGGDYSSAEASGGAAGSYTSGTVTINNTTNVLKITIGGGSAGAQYSADGGDGADGAARIIFYN